jgi:predicted XRE-type DNA-binding protein
MIAIATDEGQPKAPLTQKRAAELLGVTRWYLNRVVRGHIRSNRLSKRLDELREQHSKNSSE